MPDAPLAFDADFSPSTLARDLRTIVAAIPPGEFDPTIARLDRLFASYAALYPYGAWGAGLVVTEEMRTQTEMLLPIREVLSAFRALCRQSLLVPVADHLPLFHNASSWLDAFPRLPEPLRLLDPARLLRLLLSDDHLRTVFLFATRMPSRHGESFCRYPNQREMVAQALLRLPASDSLRCLDAGCGTGEGTFELALLALNSRRFSNISIKGVSLDPLEIFAGAHGFFPHDPVRQKEFREAAMPALSNPGTTISFVAGNVTGDETATEMFDVILCNGVLGGPFLHDAQLLERTVVWLSRRLKPGGAIFAADRFHGGWKKKVSDRMIAELFIAHGVAPEESQEGFAGRKA